MNLKWWRAAGYCNARTLAASAGLVDVAVLLCFATVGVSKVMTKFNDSRTLDAKFPSIRCNRYYHDINEHFCYHHKE
jgi:hypothetical protein